MKTINTINYLLFTKLKGIFILLHSFFLSEILIMHFVIFSMICSILSVNNHQIVFILGES